MAKTNLNRSDDQISEEFNDKNQMGQLIQKISKKILSDPSKAALLISDWMTRPKKDLEVSKKLKNADLVIKK